MDRWIDRSFGWLQVVDKDSLLLIELAALMHDVTDHKYTSRDGADDPAPRDPITAFFLGLDFDNMDVLAARVKAIVARVGFKDELAYQVRPGTNIRLD